MNINIYEICAGDNNEIMKFLTSERWDFHSVPQISAERVSTQLENGYFSGSGVKTFWICDEYNKIGLIRLFDLGAEPDSDETPLFDIKIAKHYHGKGVGMQAVKWLTDFVFQKYPAKHRFEATTRYDNIAMRRVLEKCGFVKEAHHRLAWPDEHGNKYDCTGYAILRIDWENKTKTPVEWSK